MFGNGPASARNALIPPDCSAGKNLRKRRPASRAAMISPGVMAPGSNGTSAPPPAGNVDLSEVDRYLESLKS